MRFIVATTVFSLFLVVSAIPITHPPVVVRTASGCDAQSIQARCTEPKQSMPSKDCVTQAMAECVKLSGPKTKRAGVSCGSLQLACTQQLSAKFTLDDVKKCLTATNASCDSSQPQSTNKRDSSSPTCSSISFDCATNLGSNTDPKALAACVKGVNPSCAGQSKSSNKRDSSSSSCGSISLTCATNMEKLANPASVAACAKSVNPSCGAQPQSSNKRDSSSCANISTACGLNTSNLTSVLDCIKSISNSGCPPPSQSTNKRDTSQQCTSLKLNCETDLGSKGLANPENVIACVKNLAPAC